MKSSMIPVIMLSLAIALRQMSMTIVAPFISTYCKTLSGYTPLLAGVALGVFGLMQAVFQIPFGVLSDRIGNKKMVLTGLAMVVAGLILAFFAKSIGLLIFARCLQGSGAIIGVAYSWAFSMVPQEKRTSALSILSAFISVAVALAFVVGPFLRTFMNVNWMFLACAILVLCNSLYILFFLKDCKSTTTGKAPQPGIIKKLLKDKNFIIMNIAAFLNNFLVTAVFFGIPMYLDKITGQNGMWKIFISAIAAAILIMKSAVRISEHSSNFYILIACFAVLAVSVLFFFNKSYIFLLIGMILFMGGYLSLATIVANNVNHAVRDNCRGTANGIFNSFQYIGNFAGSLITAAIWTYSEQLAWLNLIIIAVIGALLLIVTRPENKKTTEGDSI